MSKDRQGKRNGRSKETREDEGGSEGRRGERAGEDSQREKERRMVNEKIQRENAIKQRNLNRLPSHSLSSAPHFASSSSSSDVCPSSLFLLRVLHPLLFFLLLSFSL
jgi:hypothetical protein